MLQWGYAAGTQTTMDDGSWYLGYNGCIMGGTRPMDINVIVGTRSTVGCGQYSDYERVNRGMSGTCSTMVIKRTRCYDGGTNANDGLQTIEIMWY